MQFKCSDGRNEIAEPIIKDTLPRRLFRIGHKGDSAIRNENYFPRLEGSYIWE